MVYPYYQQYQAPQITPYQQQLMQQQPLQIMQQTPQVEQIKVDGPQEAMNRFLMRYPANMLVPGFISEALFDVNGKQFHTLSVEMDGRRNLETFDYQPHVEPTQAPGAVSRAEFDALADKVNQLIGGSNGIHEPVPAEPAAQ